MEYSNFADSFISLLDMYLISAVFFSLTVGMILCYFGFIAYNFAVFIFGGLFGLIFGWLLASDISSDFIKITLILIVTLASGYLALIITGLAAVMAGSLMGLLIGTAVWSGEPIASFILMLIGGGAGLFFYSVVIILSTALAGAVMLLYSYINISYFLKDDAASWTFLKFSSYIKMLAIESYSQGSAESVLNKASEDFFVLIFFVFTGVVVQIKSIFSLNSSENSLSNSVDKNEK